ncbi:hypothetical protein E2C01_089352 [Portunus trituberculatus]|uniref:Uncharacterized protein n=1 Tax=Portunus trituberculatus TaxID=210409 RepID=A0A5B7JIT8_PORTR|nr:hypothetical protein [Portunus trituberculatus]
MKHTTYYGGKGGGRGAGSRMKEREKVEEESAARMEGEWRHTHHSFSPPSVQHSPPHSTQDANNISNVNMNSFTID